MELKKQIESLNRLADQPAKIVWKDIKSIMSAYNYYTATDMSRRTGYSRQYIFKRPPIFDVETVLGKDFFKLKNDEKNRIFEHLKAIGFSHRSKSIFQKGEIEIKLLDHRSVRISFFDKETSLDFSIVADFNTADLSIVSAT
ncbi:MAG: hypothetical protein OHK0019_00500 [Saprospiraceae bacterium]